ncbi:hypothetical protein HMPREF2811_10310 [Globicatella sp. HMSC072A10]|uniref:DUF3013 family protein n=1 Tax=Globicatella sp. HMSC072A10 TaxID=1739315 RepID=UPI0008CA65E7|nr:DUF3013 family protein [Globicatella sp. HMSC072A10]OFK62444.1 hypothetical protein HMPREF2811_10310 [Globicatella sp. HMSC072A10]
MQQHNLLTYQHYLLEELYFHCEWQLSWQEDWHCIELVLQFEFENNNTDIQLNLDQADETVLYECKVLFVDPQAAHFYTPNVIQRFVVDKTKGIPTGEVTAIFKYLKQKTSQAQAEWYDFIHDDSIEHFGISWHEQDYQIIKERLVQTNQYNQQALFLPIVD